MQRLATGDEGAFTAIFRQYYPRLVSFTVKITKTEHLAEEIVQEVFLRLWKRREEFRQSNYIGSWLYRVASNLAFDFLKKAASENKLLDYYRHRPDEFGDSTADLEAKETNALVHDTVEDLPPQQKRVYRLSREEGLSHQEIADRLQISPNTVKNHLSKALQAIRNVLHKGVNFFFTLF